MTRLPAKKLGFVLLAVAAVVCVLPTLRFLLMVSSPGMFGMERPRSKRPFDEAHARAVETFVASEGFGFSRLGKKGHWNSLSVVFEDIEYRVPEIRLIGLTTELGDRWFEDQRPPLKDEIVTSRSRPLLPAEAAVVTRLRSGESSREQLPADDPENPNTIRVLAPILARQECLSCHDGKPGSMLGAFDYLLAPKSSRQCAPQPKVDNAQSLPPVPPSPTPNAANF